ncbi:MAG: NAD(P)-dependent alcohol dehydrogenase [Ignavibacteriaceae bacterium]|nr:NAD(P)-dependent alcohol dehydrogenase [Ignavibacteriaceae bacterium]
MKAIICDKYGTPEILRVAEIEKPVPKEDEVLIKVYATSVTNSDIFIRSSKVSLKLLIPFRIMMGLRGPRNPIIGEVFSGEIEYAGSRTKRFKAGDRVYGLTGFSLGAYADYLCLKESDSKRGCIALMPRNIDYIGGTYAAYGGLLALQFLEKVKIGIHSKVLIYGACGTSGTFAVQYAKYLGAHVTAVCGPENLGFIKSLGADRALDYTQSSSVKLLDKYDVVFDTVGIAKTSALKTAAKSALMPSGKYLSIDDAGLLLESDRLNEIKDLIESGAVKPVTDRVYPFEQIAEAHKYVEMGHKRGNVAVEVNSAIWN